MRFAFCATGRKTHPCPAFYVGSAIPSKTHGVLTIRAARSKYFKKHSDSGGLCEKLEISATAVSEPQFMSLLSILQYIKKDLEYQGQETKISKSREDKNQVLSTPARGPAHPTSDSRSHTHRCRA